MSEIGKFIQKLLNPAPAGRGRGVGVSEPAARSLDDKGLASLDKLRTLNSPVKRQHFFMHTCYRFTAENFVFWFGVQQAKKYAVRG